jgi:hypothetical protein
MPGARISRLMVASVRARVPWLLVCAAAVAAVYVVVFAMLRSAAFARAPDVIAAAATFDLTVTASLAVWWLGVRRGRLRWWFAVITLSYGVAMARAHVPHAPLKMLVVAGGVLEWVTIGWLAIRMRWVIRAGRAARDAGPFDAVAAGLRAGRIPARVATILATELVVVWLAVTGWFRRPRAGFAMRSTGWISFAGVLGFVIAVETAGLHIILGMWKPWLAWVSTVSSAYTLLWVIADIQMVRLYPVAITRDALRVMLGIRWRVTIPLAAIESVTECRAVPKGALDLALFEPTVLVALRAPIEVVGLLGRRRSGDRIALTIDEPAKFLAAVAAARGA